jgi:hypothetical protein
MSSPINSEELCRSRDPFFSFFLCEYFGRHFASIIKASFNFCSLLHMQIHIDAYILISEKFKLT